MPKRLMAPITDQPPQTSDHLVLRQADRLTDRLKRSLDQRQPVLDRGDQAAIDRAQHDSGNPRSRR